MASPLDHRGNHGRRGTPPPIRLSSTHSNLQSGSSAANLSSTQSPTQLLYELPPSSPLRSPPPKSARLRSRSPPYSPSPSDRRTSFGAALQTRPTKPSIDGQGILSDSPSTWSRAGLNQASLEPKQSDLDAFADLCNKWYYDQDALSGRLMSQTLTKISPAHRATYTRLQASIRSNFHCDQSLRRISEFRALLSSTEPGNSLTLASRADPLGSLARKERFEKFKHFIQSQCVSGVPGTHPFFEGLYGMIRLQTLPVKLGGSGDRLIEWEIDDAVFMESAGKDFSTEAVDVLKGVLGFRESLGDTDGIPSTPASVFSDTDMSEVGEDRNADGMATPTKMRRINSTPVQMDGSQSRASSDPFMDPSRSYNSMLHVSATMDDATDVDSAEPLTPVDDQHTDSLIPKQVPKRNPMGRMDITIPSLSEPQLRTWTFPASLTNPELQKLLALFPSSITRQNVPRFKSQSTSGPSPRELEEGALATSTSGMEIHVGTGKMRLTNQPRHPTWRGGLWERVLGWFLSIFG
ncbi:hypothetical protein BS47DRAFT_1482489 [Hydnum rufescens UP504]|uniref:Uncharacterized protein n=1 Tax=Hydnum rufescens UP504 TaxID=1448309 RepID=A0A9P6B6H1_9AGAM|nr:hypothetical protein BS47DRAFT_1482489 [Hydnum rufescens UP504]